MGRISAIIRQRCPICLQGKVFQTLLQSYKHCPVCGVRFERETGYYLNAMFVAYLIGFLILAPLALALYIVGVAPLTFLLIVGGIILVLWPFIFRYSRVIWLHVDQMIDPRARNGK